MKCSVQKLKRKELDIGSKTREMVLKSIRVNNRYVQEILLQRLRRDSRLKCLHTVHDGSSALARDNNRYGEPPKMIGFEDRFRILVISLRVKVAVRVGVVGVIAC